MLKIETEKFSGPLDLLLNLTEKEEFDITKISLAKIADQYIDHIKNSSEIKPEEMADFLFVAARLLFIKSKVFFPYFTCDSEEDDGESLEEQLKMYKNFLEATKSIEAIIERRQFMFSRIFNKKRIVYWNEFSPPKKIKKEDLAANFKNFIDTLKPKQKLQEKKIERVINIEEKIARIQKELSRQSKICFNKMFNNSDSKMESIVSFLAMLELIKQKSINALQENLFDDIMMVRI